MNHDDVPKNIVAVAMGEDNVRAVVLTGSAARGGGELHVLSDLDVEVGRR